MGYDIGRFQGEVDEELLCPICTGVLEDPIQAPSCEHAFCRGCINEWVSRQPTCPVDRLVITSAHLRPVPRITRNLLSRLNINCDNALYGCSSVLKLNDLANHVEECEFNPKRPIPCDLGCGLVIPKDEIKDHNCVKELRALIQKYQEKLSDFQQQLSEQRFQLEQQKQELSLLKEFMRAMRVSNPNLRALADQMEQDEVVRWSATLPRARVTRWGGMISTPDALLQAAGLSSLETRQSNRRSYENYVCKKVPGKQAVVVLHCDNHHMTDDMITEPGLLMIFAHGIE
ncbi:RING finger protein, putative [Pediculus humanus corporis]|uniref:E3 ubiquitin-protein ligase NRDP1 n=1 Tax=Pediculus humanus subsp. corporis TaxID=121224 RepID=E0VW63_PEDHC|nr:RING finger protein, putative [Pediculus humanus corporis]EEB17619.1 RING finger protein, putative [Pediculus humanus corporis]